MSLNSSAPVFMDEIVRVNYRRLRTIELATPRRIMPLTDPDGQDLQYVGFWKGTFGVTIYHASPSIPWSGHDRVVYVSLISRYRMETVGGCH